MTTILIWSVVAIGLNILTGYNGQISLGHGAFVTIGAYTAVILTDDQQQLQHIHLGWLGLDSLHLGWVDGAPWPFWTAMIMSGLVAAAAGALVGIPSLRLSGPYLAVATLALVIALPSFFERYEEVFGGRLGIRTTKPPPPPLLEDILSRDQWFYFLALVCLSLLVVMAWVIVRSRWGRAFVAIRDTEVGAASVGISVARYKVLAFTVSAFYAGIAGSLFVFAWSGLISPESVSITTSINFFTAIVIGGMGSIMGSIIGGFVVVLLPELSTEVGDTFLSEENAKRLWPTFYGGILIAVIIAMPFGVAGFLHRLARVQASGLRAGVQELPQRVSLRIQQMAEDISWSLGRGHGGSRTGREPRPRKE